MATPLPKHRAREYETIFILNPEITTDGIEQIASRLTDVVTRLDGKLLQAENWGKRRLAYPVRKHPKGYYIYLRYLGYSGMVHELERNMRMLEPVLKYLTVKLEEDVDPTARPVNEEEISFLPQVEEVVERPRSKTPTSSTDSEESAKASEETAEVVKEEPAETPEKPATAPEEPIAAPEEPAAAPEEPAAAPEEPVAAPEEPAETQEEPAAETETEAETDSADEAKE